MTCGVSNMILSPDFVYKCVSQMIFFTRFFYGSKIQMCDGL